MPDLRHERHFWGLEGVVRSNVAVDLEIAPLEATVTGTAQFENEVLVVLGTIENVEVRVLMLQLINSGPFNIRWPSSPTPYRLWGVPSHLATKA